MPSSLFMRLSLLSVVLAIAACSASSQPAANRDEAPPPPRIDNGPGADACGAQSVQDRIGRAFGDALREAIAEESGAGRVRVLRPGDMATMDHRPDRLNIHLDNNDVIARIECG